MKNDEIGRYAARDRILKLLTDEEVARVSDAETARRLDEGDEYVDLEQLAQGVRRADGVPAQMTRILPRKAVHEMTWNKILAELGPAAQA